MLPSNVPEFETVRPAARRLRPPIAGLIVTVVLALALVAVIAVAVTRLSGGSLPRPSAVTAPTQAAATSATAAPAAATRSQSPAAGTPADAATAQAIQQVIQRVDEAQVQAIASNDPNVMAPTATAEFYQEQVNANQDLVNGGVTEIKLMKLDWGDITVNGNTASATVWETWSTTFKDGTTEQSRDRNVYTLVMDNGTWKVSADDHPDQQSPGSVTNPPRTP